MKVLAAAHSRADLGCFFFFFFFESDILITKGSLPATFVNVF